ncbi:MAG: hypothetical protein J6Z34_03625 [Clostridia bacterium]|nr:hypothetical protein [Clostridia bacterium]
MLDAVLVRRNASLKVKITVKSIVALCVIIGAVALPQLVHLALGQPGGVQWLPMYLPVLVGGCLLGPVWGLGVGILSPAVSFAITSAWGNPMPIAARLPYMMAELGVFALVTGLFSKKISENKWFAFPAVLLAQFSGRAVFLVLTAVFQSVSTLKFTAVWSQVQAGGLGLFIQALIVPFIIIGLQTLAAKDKDE